MTRLGLSAAIWLLLAVGLFGQVNVPRPDAGPPSRDATPTATAGGEQSAEGCSEIPDYYQALNEGLSNAGEFSTYLLSADYDYEALTTKEAQGLVDDGNGLIDDLKAMDVPPVYAQGHEGIIGFLTYLNQEVSFYTLDSSTVPDINGFGTSLQLVYDGETNAAEHCPKQIRQTGGFIFINPDDLKDQVDTGD